jgi:hypothetical protein
VANERQDTVEESALSEKKEETMNNSLRALDVEVLAILGTFAPTDWKSKMMVIYLDQLAPYEATAWDERHKGGSNGSGWRVNTVKYRATGRKVRPSTDVESTALRKEEMTVCLKAIWDE